MSETIYAWLLWFYPAEFRKQYGEAMLQLFRDRLRAERNWSGIARLWLEIVCDLAVSVPRQHFTRSSPPRNISEGYWVSEEGAREMVRHRHLQPAGQVLLAISLGIAVGSVGDAPLGVLLAVFSPFVIPVLSSFRGRRRAMDYWLGYQIRVEREHIVLIRPGAEPVTLQRSEIVSLLETPGLGLAIGTSNPRRSIWAPSVLTGYGDLRSTLEAWVPLERNELRKSPIGIHSHMGALWLFWAWAVAMAVLSPYVFAPMAVIASVGLVLLGYEMFKAHVPARVKAVPVCLELALFAKLLRLLLAT